MKSFFSGIFMLLAFATRAQVDAADAQFNLNAMSSGSSMFRSYDNRFKGIEGNPFIFEEYQSGRILMKTGKIYFQDKINYDAYKNDIIVIHKGNELFLNKGIIKGFELFVGADTLTFRKIVQGGNNDFFVQVLVDAPISLLKKTEKTIVAPTNTGAYSTGKLNSEFETKQKYYWLLKEGSLKEIKNKRDFLSQFSASDKELEVFMKKNKLDLKTEGDLLQIFSYLNSRLLQSTNEGE